MYEVVMIDIQILQTGLGYLKKCTKPNLSKCKDTHF